MKLTETVDVVRFGAAVKAARALLGMTQQELADWHNVVLGGNMKAATISHIEIALNGSTLLSVIQNTLELAGIVFADDYTVTLRDRDQHLRFLHGSAVLGARESNAYPNGLCWTNEELNPLNFNHRPASSSSHLIPHLKWLGVEPTTLEEILSTERERARWTLRPDPTLG